MAAPYGNILNFSRNTILVSTAAAPFTVPPTVYRGSNFCLFSVVFCSGHPNGCELEESCLCIDGLITFVMMSVYALKTEQTSNFFSSLLRN